MAKCLLIILGSANHTPPPITCLRVCSGSKSSISFWVHELFMKRNTDLEIPSHACD